MRAPSPPAPTPPAVPTTTPPAPPLRAVRALLTLCAAAAALQAVVLIAVQAHLFADGAFYLYWLLDARRPMDFDAGRHFTHLVTQWPLVLAMRAGVTEVGAISRLLGAMWYGPMLAALALCAWIARRRPELLLFPLASAAAVTANSSFFVVSESHLLVALFWPLVFLLALRDAWGAGTFALAAVLAAPTLRTYESMVFLGPVLAALAIVRARSEPRAAARAGFVLLAAYFAAGVGVAAYWIVNPRSAGNRGSFVEASLFFFRDHEGHVHALALLSLAAIALVAAALLVRAPGPGARRARRLVFAAFVAACALAAVAPLLRPMSVAPLLHYRARVLNAYLPPLLAVLFVLAMRRPPRAESWRSALAVVTVLAVAQLAWHTLAARVWAGYLDAFRREVTTHRGLVPFDRSALARAEEHGRPIATLNWGWTMPIMSVLLAPGGRVRAMVDNPEGASWVPFSPAIADSLPDLSRYGIRFDEYRAALGRPNGPAPR